jgi:Carboxypeptidase regulatory-like domain
LLWIVDKSAAEAIEADAECEAGDHGMKRLGTSALLFFFIGLACSSLLAECTCKHAPKSDTTRWGGNMSIEINQQAPLRTVHGRVARDDEPVEGALVEVFEDNGQLPGSRDSKPAPKRIAACISAKDGKFCFKGLRSGKYEIRSSVDSGWNVTHVLVTVDAKKGTDVELSVAMSLGT